MFFGATMYADRSRPTADKAELSAVERPLRTASLPGIANNHLVRHAYVTQAPARAGADAAGAVEELHGA